MAKNFKFRGKSWHFEKFNSKKTQRQTQCSLIFLCNFDASGKTFVVNQSCNLLGRRDSKWISYVMMMALCSWESLKDTQFIQAKLLPFKGCQTVIENLLIICAIPRDLQYFWQSRFKNPT